MTLTFAPIMASADIDPAEALVIRHAYVGEHAHGTVGIHGDSSDAEIMAYTRVQSAGVGCSMAGAEVLCSDRAGKIETSSGRVALLARHPSPKAALADVAVLQVWGT